MKVIIAQISGFCDGVKRAMRIALEASKEGGIWADGPLVHNEQAVSLLSLQGISASPAPGPGDDKVLVRAHGATPERRREWEEMGLRTVDATCVHVARNQRLAADAAAKGATVVLAGDPDHAEVRAVTGAAGPGCLVISTPEDAERLRTDGDLFLLAQTTFNVESFRVMAETLRRRFPGCRVVDTICRATHDRQAEAARIARLADVLVVVGGRHSANTRRLADMGRAQGKPVFLVETADELRDEDFAAFGTAAVTSGASTPGWVTQEVVNRLRRMGRSTPLSLLLRLFSSLAESRVVTALAAAGFALAAQFHILERVEPILALAGAGFVFFAHTLNRRVPADPEARRLSLVDSFYQSRRPPLLVAAWLASAVALLLAATAGVEVFALFVAAVLAAAAYAYATRRRGRAGKGTGNPRRIWILALGWAALLAGPPALESGRYGSGVAAGLFVCLVCFGGTLIRDLHDVASDRLMGIDTLPSRLGLARAERLAARALTLAGALSLASSAAALVLRDESIVWIAFTGALAAVPALGLLLLRLMRKGRLPDAVMLQAGVDGMGCLAGCIALIAGGLS